MPDGDLTPPLYRLHVGDTLSLRRAAKAGRSASANALRRASHPAEPRAPSPKPRRFTLFLCTVTGVAPFLSLVRTLAQDARDGKPPSDTRLFLIEGASRSSELGYNDELEQLARELPWLTYVPTVSRPWDDAGWSGEVGRVDDVIRRYADQWIPNPMRGMAHLCGHPSMINTARRSSPDAAGRRTGSRKKATSS